MKTHPYIQNAQDLLEKLDFFGKSKNVAFRGHENAAYFLVPNAYRQQTLIATANEFPVSRAEINKWFVNEEIKNFVKDYTKQHQYHSLVPPVIQRFFNYNIHLTQYNHKLHDFLRKNPKYASPKDLELIEMRGEQFWTEVKSFVHLIQGTYPWLINYDFLNGTRRKAKPIEDVTGLDETFSQHYGVATSAMDWSLNYLVAIYFAIHKLIEIDPITQSYRLTKLPNFPKTLSIFTCEKINTGDQMPFDMKSRSEIILNQRAINQKGAFIFFKNTCSHFMQHNEFPSLNYYNARAVNGVDTKFFDFTRFNVEVNLETLLILKEHLEKHNINKAFLLPELDSL
ncbi:MAG: FRG domain-containing protein [Pseudomonadota bacterium]